jgi:FtsP/CotA-like multicopper oxidase with cupredoxin domain
LSLEPFGRRELFAGTGGLFLCTLGGQKIFADQGEADLGELSKAIPVPPKVAAAQASGTAGAASAEALARAGGNRREYWIQAEEAKWNIVPTGRDGMMDVKVKGKTKFTAWVYRQYSENFGEPIGPPMIPGPTIDCYVGDTVVFNFRNKLPSPVTVHPHGIRYTEDMDGAYKGRDTDPSGFVQTNQTFQYVWEAVPGTEGSWIYHDHGPMEPMPVYKGLFGQMIVRPEGSKPADREFFISFHSFQPPATGLQTSFSCINGNAYAGNTPTLRANVGESVAFHVVAIDNDFHTFHVHGHRWVDETGTVVDNKTLGPGDSITATFTEDNPGRWLYHCHVWSHISSGMNGWYIVE